jgi:hypothetical protein
MGSLNEQQIALAIKAMNEYISASNSEGKTIVGIENNIDQKREQIIESHFPQMSIQFSQFLLLSFFLKTASFIQTCVFEISYTFRFYAFTESF